MPAENTKYEIQTNAPLDFPAGKDLHGHSYFNLPMIADYILSDVDICDSLPEYHSGEYFL